MFHLGPDVTLIWKKNHRCSHPIKEWQRKEQQFFLYNSRCLFHFLAMLGLQHSRALQYFIAMALPWFWNWKLLIFLAWVCCGAAPSSFTKCVKSSQLCDGDVNGKPNCNSPLLLPFWLTLLLKKSTAKKGATIFALLTCQICFCPCNQVIGFAKKQNRRGSYIKALLYNNLAFTAHIQWTSWKNRG